MSTAKSSNALPDSKERARAIQELLEEFGVLDRREIFGLLSREWNMDLSAHEAAILQNLRELVKSGAIKNHEDNEEFIFSPEPTVIVEEISVSKSKAWSSAKKTPKQIKGIEEIKLHGFDIAATSTISSFISVSRELPPRTPQTIVCSFTAGKETAHLLIEKLAAPFRIWFGRAGEFSPKHCLGILESFKAKGWPARERNIVLQIPQTTVSAFRDGRPGHASIWFEEDEYRILDLNSTNGSFIGDIPSEKFSGAHKSLEITQVPTSRNLPLEITSQRIEEGSSNHFDTPSIIQLANEFRMIWFEANQAPKAERTVSKFLKQHLGKK